MFLHETKNFRVKQLFFPKIMTISTDLAVSNSRSSFVLLAELVNSGCYL